MRRAHLACLLLGAAIAAPAAADDLLDVYLQARRNDPVLAQAQAAFRAVEELRPQARATLLPSLSASAEQSWVDQEQDLTLTGQSSDNYNSDGYALQLTQPLFRYASLKLLRQAKARIAQAQAELTAAEQQQILRVAQAYFGVLAAADALAFARAEREAIVKQLEQAQQRFEVGLVPVTDVQEARARRDLALAEVIAAENQLASARAQLSEITGAAHQDLAQLAATVPLAPPEPAQAEPWQAKAAEQNWELLAARKGTEVAMQTVGIRRADHLPTVDLVARYGEEDQGGGRFAGQTDTGSVSLQLNVPLYRGGATSSRVREAQYQYDQALARLEEVQRDVVRRAGDAYRGVQSSILRARALEQALTSSRMALEAVQAGYEVGIRTLVEVLNAQQERFRAQRNYQQAQYDYLLNGLRLKLAVGTLSEADLAAANRLLKD